MTTMADLAIKDFSMNLKLPGEQSGWLKEINQQLSAINQENLKGNLAFLKDLSKEKLGKNIWQEIQEKSQNFLNDFNEKKEEVKERVGEDWQKLMEAFKEKFKSFTDLPKKLFGEGNGILSGIKNYFSKNSQPFSFLKEIFTNAKGELGNGIKDLLNLKLPSLKSFLPSLATKGSKGFIDNLVSFFQGGKDSVGGFMKNVQNITKGEQEIVAPALKGRGF